MVMRTAPRYRVLDEIPLDRLRAALQGRVELAVLFGSVVTGNTHPESDVDLAVWPRRETNVDALLLDVMTALDTEDVDLVDLRRASGTLQIIVATRGSLVLEDPRGRFAEFASQAERRWQDDLHLLPYRLLQTDLWLEKRGLR